MEQTTEIGYRNFGELGIGEKAVLITKLSGLAVKGALLDYFNTANDMFDSSGVIDRSKRLHCDAERILKHHNVEPDLADRFF